MRLEMQDAGIGVDAGKRSWATCRLKHTSPILGAHDAAGNDLSVGSHAILHAIYAQRPDAPSACKPRHKGLELANGASTMNGIGHATSADESYAPFLEALLAGDRSRCRSIFEAWLDADLALRVLYQERIQPALYRVGELWEQGRVSVATEHLATAITEGLLGLLYPRLFDRPDTGRSAVVACAANEYHQIGGRMVADLFELHGWRGHFLGANTPQRDLIELIHEKDPDAVVLSLAVHFNLDSLVRAADAVRTDFPDVPILVGGQAFRWGGIDRVARIPRLQYLPSLVDLEAWMDGPEHHAP